jgi:hypothetical protein
MLRFWLTSLLCCLICSCSGPASPAAAPAAGPELELPPPAGWPPHFPPALAHDVAGVDELTGAHLQLERAYLFHRTDVEQLLVAGREKKGCETRLDACMVASAPSFWDSASGRVLIGAMGYAAGAVTTVLIVWGVGSATGW